MLISSIFLAGFAHAATNPKGQTINGGMAANLTDAILNNYGTIIGGVDVAGGYNARVGMYGDFATYNTSFNFSNSGTININHVTSGAVDIVYGMHITDGFAGVHQHDHTLSNTGNINVNLSALDATAWGGGMVVQTNGNHTLNNSGDITVNISRRLTNPQVDMLFARGMFAEGTGNHTLHNSGNVTAIATEVGDVDYAKAYGMRANGTGNHKLTNSGNITAIASLTATTAIIAGDTEAYGMYADGAGNHTLNNTGNITVSATSSATTTDDTDAYGMFADGGNSHNLTNSGNITVTATATATNTDDAEAYGMRANGTGNNNLSSSGTILATAIDLNEKAEAYGMYAEGAGNHTLSNAGTIIATAIAHNDDAEAYGIYVQGTPPAGTHNLSNTGIIIAKAMGGSSSKAYEAYGKSSYNVNTWATTLRTWSGNDAVFGTSAAGVNVNFNNSKLILRPDTAARGFVLGQDYTVASMVSLGGTQQATISGSIVEVVAEVPFLKAVLGGTVAAPTVRLDNNISEKTTPGTATMQQAVAQVQGQFNNLSKSLRNALVEIYAQANLVADATQNSTSGVAAGSGMSGVAAGFGMSPQNKWQVFINPYANTVNNSKYDYNGNNMGITAGASYRVNDNFSFGGHLDFNSANYYGELMDMSTKSTSFALGLHAAYNFTPECYLRGQLTGSVNQNDSYFTASPTLNGDANYNGEALYIALASGYIWQIAKGHTLTPEIGLAYLGTHTGAYDIEWSIAGYDMSYADSYYNAFYGTLSLDWRSEWDLQNDSSIALLAGLGLRQNLGSGEMETSLRAFGSNFTTKSTEDPTTFLADVGVEYKKGNFSVSLNYEGGYGAHQTSHGGNVMLKLEF